VPLSRTASLLSRWVPVVAYAALISFLSGRSDLDIPKSISDKVAHAIEFGIFGALLWRASTGGLLARGTWARAIAALALCAVYAGADELHQSFVPGRDASFWDAAADVGGAAAAIVLLWAAPALLRLRGDPQGMGAGR